MVCCVRILDMANGADRMTHYFNGWNARQGRMPDDGRRQELVAEWSDESASYDKWEWKDACEPSSPMDEYFFFEPRGIDYFIDASWVYRINAGAVEKWGVAPTAIGWGWTACPDLTPAETRATKKEERHA